MAIDIKEIISNAFLELCEEMPMKKIKVSDINGKCGVSRGAFYNHFYSKDDLVEYIYLTRVIPDFASPSGRGDYRASLTRTFDAYEKYFNFMYRACRLEGSSSLALFMIKHAKEWDRNFYKSVNISALSPLINVVINYMAIASMQITVDWILAQMPVPKGEMVDCIVRIRDACIIEMFDSDVVATILYSHPEELPE